VAGCKPCLPCLPLYRQLTLLRRFRWIYCQYDTLRRCFAGDVRRTLDELPITLNETYEQILQGIDEEKQDLARRIFQCLVVCKRPLRVEELAELFSVQLDTETIPTFYPHWRPVDPEEAVLSTCSTLVTFVNVDGKKVVQFSHFSVKEYLTSDHIASSGYLSRFRVHPRPAHALLARACLSVLLHLDDRINRDNIQDFPLALYAAQYWVDHARFENASSDVHHAIERLFDRNKPHFAAWLWLYDVDNPFDFFMTPVYAARPYPVLYYAALCGFRDLAEHLVDAHPQDLNARSGTRGTPLHAALDGWHQNQSLAMLLLEHGADIGCLDSQSRTPLHIACHGCTDVVSVLIDRGADLEAEDDSRETPLHVASQWGRGDIIQLLLDHGAEADHLDSGGWTSMHVASHEGHDKIVQLLFDHGADANRPDNGGWTPLHLASWEGHEHIARLLLDHGINANHPDNDGWTPLHAASQEGHYHSVELLLNHGADPNYANSDGSTSLHLALQRNYYYIVQLLLDRGADLNYPNGDGSTSLHLASQRGHDNIVWFLLHHGAVANRLNGDGWASLHLASQRGHYDVVGLLLEHGADSNHAHGNGLTPLHLASQEGHDHIVRLLLDRGADANSLNSDGWTPLHLASQRGHDRIVRLLLEHRDGADADHPNSDSLAPVGFERKPPKGFAIATRTRQRFSRRRF
jgi:ankyrin repeat protein